MTTKVPPAMLEEGSEAVGLVPVGALVPFAGATVPANWLLAQGQSLVRADYAELFTAIGTTYGSASGTTFNAPDLRGRVAAGRDNMGGTPANRLTTGVSGIDGAQLGAAGGNQNLHQHSHGVNDPGHAHTFIGGEATNIGADTSAMSLGVGFDSGGGGTIGNATTGVTVQNAGSGSSQNVQPTIVLNWIIRAK